MRSLEETRFGRKSTIDHTQCIDCMFCHFVDFSKLNDMMDHMHVKESYVDINNMSLGVCYKFNKIVGMYDMSCEYFKPITMDTL